MTLIAPGLHVQARPRRPATVGRRLLRFCTAMTEPLPPPSANGAGSTPSWSAVGGRAVEQVASCVIAAGLIAIATFLYNMNRNVDRALEMTNKIPELIVKIEQLENDQIKIKTTLLNRGINVPP